VGEDKLYTILVKTEGTSDPKEVESIDKAIGSPSDAVKNQDQIRKRIDKLSSGVPKESPDWKASIALSTKLSGVLKNAVRGFDPAPKTKTSKADDQTTKELKEAAADSKEAAS
jgi:hypothetical protein